MTQNTENSTAEIMAFKDPRLPYVAVGLIFFLMFGIFSVVLVRPGGFVLTALLTGFVAAGSLLLCGYSRSVVLDRGRKEARVLHTLYSVPVREHIIENGNVNETRR